MGYAVSECGVNGDGAAEIGLRAGNSFQPDLAKFAASLLLVNNCAGT